SRPRRGRGAPQCPWLATRYAQEAREPHGGDDVPFQLPQACQDARNGAGRWWPALGAPDDAPIRAGAAFIEERGRQREGRGPPAPGLASTPLLTTCPGSAILP